MRRVARVLEAELVRAARAFSVILLTGPRRSGKTTLLRRAFPKAAYRLLEDPDELSRIRHDPRAFVGSLPTPVILDEIQNAPELLGYLLIEAKASQTLVPEMAGPILRLRASAARRQVDGFVVCPGAGPAGHAGLGEGVRGVGIENLTSQVLGLQPHRPVK